MANRIRNKQVKFYVTDEEYDLIMKNYNQSKARSLTDFLRKMSINGRIFEVDLSSVFKFNNEINAIGNNLNQVARKINTYDYADTDDIDFIKNSIKEIKKTQKEILNEINIKR